MLEFGAFFPPVDGKGRGEGERFPAAELVEGGRVEGKERVDIAARSKIGRRRRFFCCSCPWTVAG